MKERVPDNSVNAFLNNNFLDLLRLQRLAPRLLSHLTYSDRVAHLQAIPTEL
jgi:hypothetical protein